MITIRVEKMGLVAPMFVVTSIAPQGRVWDRGEGHDIGDLKCYMDESGAFGQWLTPAKFPSRGAALSAIKAFSERAISEGLDKNIYHAAHPSAVIK